MVLVHDTLVDCAPLEVDEISTKLLSQCSHYRADKKLHLVMLQGEYLENKHASVMVLVHDTLSECVLQMYEISLKYL